MSLQKISIGNHIKDDLTNKQFGYLTVLYRTTNSPSGRTRWACQCKCGKIIPVATSDLKNGHTKSCGCLKREINSQKQEINEVGNKYGKLTVIKKSGRTKDRHTTWLCKCDCGNEIVAMGKLLRNGEILSCGCLKTSYGEYKITQLLINNKIPFIREHIFQTCKFDNSNYLARFDFYVDNKYLIEYDGEQHFTYTSNGWNTEENFKKTQERDRFKNQWCKENNIPLIRIPYTQLDNLKIEDLLLETSQFIVKE